MRRDSGGLILSGSYGVKHQSRIAVELIAVVADYAGLGHRLVGQSGPLDSTRLGPRSLRPGAAEQLPDSREIQIDFRSGRGRRQGFASRLKVHFGAERHWIDQSRVVECVGPNSEAVIQAGAIDVQDHLIRAEFEQVLQA